MQKVRFLQDFSTFAKDSFRVILGEDGLFFQVQTDLHSSESTLFHKSNNGVIFQVVERS